MKDLSIFEKNGGEFLIPAEALKLKMKSVKAFIFDWDGVFNDSSKTGSNESYYTEVDSMGTNLLRFSNWLMREKELPFAVVISGEDNKSAEYFLTRENFHACYFKAKDKKIALQDFCKRFGLHANEIAFVFDDVLDLSLAELAGVRILVKRKANPLFEEFVRKNKLADYITGCECGNFALREACELMTGLQENFETVISERIKYSGLYNEYITARKKVETEFFSLKDEVLKKLK